MTDPSLLLLVPTDLERRRFEDQGGLGDAAARLELCGFGPIAAAARTAELIARRHPARVLLVGIAGAYDAERCPVGTALEFDEVAVDGIGVGEGRELVAPPALGFPQWPGEAGSGGDAIQDRLALAAPRVGPARLLLTTCAASANRAAAEIRRERFPDALAEDMEGFAVALACALAGVPLRIVRGISNVVGDRSPESWRIPAALAAARRAALAILASNQAWVAR
jgi:futalosine hydrolase